MAGEQTTAIGIDYEAILRARIRIYGYASAMTNTEIVVTKTEHVDRVPGTHDKWLRSIRTDESINWKKNTRRCFYTYNVIRSYTHFETQKREEWTGLDVVTLYYYRASACVLVFFYIYYTVSKLIWTHRERSHARLMEFYSALETVFLGLYYAPASPVYIGTHVLIGMTTTTTLDVLISAPFTRILVLNDWFVAKIFTKFRYIRILL